MHSICDTPCLSGETGIAGTAAFWDDLARDRRNPESLREFIVESLHTATIGEEFDALDDRGQVTDALLDDAPPSRTEIVTTCTEQKSAAHHLHAPPNASISTAPPCAPRSLRGETPDRVLREAVDV